MKNKLSYVLLASLLVAGSSAFAMMGESGDIVEKVVSGRTQFQLPKSTALELLDSGKTFEVNGHHYKVTGEVTGEVGEHFMKNPKSKEILTFSPQTSALWEYQWSSWQHMGDLSGYILLHLQKID